MQVDFLKCEQDVKAFEATISKARFARYVNASGGNALHAVQLYHWNSLLSQAIYLPLQVWEIALRNKLNDFLTWKYGASWPHDDRRALRQLTGNDKARVAKAKDRIAQNQGINASSVSTDSIVAELSAGFWVSMLTGSYNTPFAWRYNLARVFPALGQLDRLAVSEICGRLLDLRNRVAHHEPILHMPLEALRGDLETVTAALCPVVTAYATSTCTFTAVFAKDPRNAA